MDLRFARTAARAVIIQKGKILVEWFPLKSISFLPGGTLQPGETPLVALTRELSEEVGGASFSIQEYLGTIGHRWREGGDPGGLGSCLNHFFRATLTQEKETYSLETGRELRWIEIKPNELRNLQPPSLRSLLLGVQPSLQGDFFDDEE